MVQKEKLDVTLTVITKKQQKKATITMKSMGSPHLDTHNVI